jgi:ketosteroid isomerase-like protein
MSEENVEVVRRTVEGFAAGDDVFAAGLVSAESEYHPAVELPGVETYVGSEGFAEFMALWTENFDDWKVRLKDVRGHGDRVIAFAHQEGIGKTSGAPVYMDFAMVFTLREGQVIDVRAFLDDEEALAAAGLGSGG